MSSGELDELDADDDDDLAMLASIRARRMAELQARSASASRGVTEISQSEYVKEVSECDDWIALHLYKDDNPACVAVHAAMETLSASRAPPVKMLRIVSTAAIVDYPDSLVPSLFIYHKKDLVKKIVSPAAFPGGTAFNADDLEWMLVGLGAMRSDMEEDPRADEIEDSRSRLMRSTYITSL